MARRHQISAMIGDTDPAGRQGRVRRIALMRAFGGLLGGLLLLSAP